MKKIKQYFDDIPKNIDPKKLSKVFDEIITTKKAESKHYNRVGVKEELLKIFGNCCAFCEKRVETGAHIEHYRPKNTYYWLGATWSNLLIACAECNTAKGDNFEIEGTLAKLPTYADWDDFVKKTHILYSDLVNELPKMLHPVLDDWEEHLQFEAKGTITAKTNKGQYLLDKCNINDWDKRQILINDRKYICEEIKKRVSSLKFISNDDDFKKVFEEILLNIMNKIEDITTPHAAVYRTCFNNFNKFIIEEMEEPFRSRLRKAYQEI